MKGGWEGEMVKGEERKGRKEGVLCVLSVVSYTTHFQEVEHHGEKRLQNQRTQRSVELKCLKTMKIATCISYSVQINGG